MSRKQRIGVDYPGELPHFPICELGREGCQMLGFHGHLSHRTEDEAKRIWAWRAWLDSQTGRP